jgi:transcriptional repressor NrdR
MMRCPWCGHAETKVIDSRPAEDGGSIRRRRECESCGKRFTTFERAQALGLRVIKRDGTKEPYDRTKMIGGLRKAFVNRPVTDEDISELATRVENELRPKGPEVTTQEIGLEVLAQLRAADDVAYLRFASVYKDFQQVTDFEKELGILLKKRELKRPARRR